MAAPGGPPSNPPMSPPSAVVGALVVTLPLTIVFVPVDWPPPHFVLFAGPLLLPRSRSGRSLTKSPRMWRPPPRHMGQPKAPVATKEQFWSKSRKGEGPVGGGVHVNSFLSGFQVHPSLGPRPRGSISPSGLPRT